MINVLKHGVHLTSLQPYYLHFKAENKWELEGKPVSHTGPVANQRLRQRKKSGSSGICQTFACKYQGPLGIRSAEILETGRRVAWIPSILIDLKFWVLHSDSMDSLCQEPELQGGRANSPLRSSQSDKAAAFSQRWLIPHLQGTLGNVWTHHCESQLGEGANGV